MTWYIELLYALLAPHLKDSEDRRSLKQGLRQLCNELRYYVNDEAEPAGSTSVKLISLSYIFRLYHVNKPENKVSIIQALSDLSWCIQIAEPMVHDQPLAARYKRVIDDESGSILRVKKDITFAEYSELELDFFIERLKGEGLVSPDTLLSNLIIALARYLKTIKPTSLLRQEIKKCAESIKFNIPTRNGKYLNFKTCLNFLIEIANNPAFNPILILDKISNSEEPWQLTVAFSILQKHPFLLNRHYELLAKKTYQVPTSATGTIAAVYIARSLQLAAKHRLSLDQYLNHIENKPRTSFIIISTLAKINLLNEANLKILTMPPNKAQYIINLLRILVDLYEADDMNSYISVAEKIYDKGDELYATIIKIYKDPTLNIDDKVGRIDNLLENKQLITCSV